MRRAKYMVRYGCLFPHDRAADADMARLTNGEIVELHMFKLAARDVLSNILAVLYAKIAAAKGWRVSTARGAVMILAGRAKVVTLFGRPVTIPWSQGDMRRDALEAFA